MRGLLAPLIKLIIFLVITALTTYVLAATITNQSFGDTSSYKAVFTDVTGLQEGDDVRIAGVRVGTVSSIELKSCPKKDFSSDQCGKDGKSYALVGFTVQQSTKLSKNVEVRSRYRNLVGQRYLDVEGQPGSTDALKAGSTIGVDHTQNAVDLTVLFTGFGNLVQGLDATQLNQLAGNVVAALQNEGGALNSLLANVANLTNKLADKDAVIGDVIDNLTEVLTTIGNRDSELTNLVIELRKFISGLAADRTTIGNSIDGINNLATSTAGLLTQVRAPLKTDLTDLNGLLTNLNNNKPTVTYVLQQLAPTVAGLIRTAQYGSWFNFYLCQLSGTISLGGTSQKINLVNNSAARCN